MSREGFMEALEGLYRCRGQSLCKGWCEKAARLNGDYGKASLTRLIVYAANK